MVEQIIAPALQARAVFRRCRPQVFQQWISGFFARRAMVRCVSAALMIVVYASPAFAGNRETIDRYLHLYGDLHADLRLAAIEMKEIHCSSEECLALYDVNSDMDVMNNYFFHNSLVSLSPPSTRNRWPDIRRSFQKGILVHPERFGAVCDLLVRVTARTKSDISINAETMILAMMMDRKWRGHCMDQILAVYPHGVDMDDYLKDTMQEVCEDKKLGRCSDLRRPAEVSLAPSP